LYLYSSIATWRKQYKQLNSENDGITLQINKLHNGLLRSST